LYAREGETVTIEECEQNWEWDAPLKSCCSGGFRAQDPLPSGVPPQRKKVLPKKPPLPARHIGSRDFTGETSRGRRSLGRDWSETTSIYPARKKGGFVVPEEKKGRTYPPLSYEEGKKRDLGRIDFTNALERGGWMSSKKKTCLGHPGRLVEAVWGKQPFSTSFPLS